MWIALAWIAPAWIVTEWIMTDWIWIIVALLVIAGGACWQAMALAGRMKSRPRASLRARRAEAFRRGREESGRTTQGDDAPARPPTTGEDGDEP